MWFGKGVVKDVARVLAVLVKMYKLQYRAVTFANVV